MCRVGEPETRALRRTVLMFSIWKAVPCGRCSREEGGGAVIFSVTTLRDTPSNVEKFVRRNLGGGVDHQVVFLDGQQLEAAAMLESNPHVNVVTTDDDWWRTERPTSLNLRQMVNAEATRRVLGPLKEAQWLFHIDGDEVVRLDRDLLDRVEPEWQAVGLATLEAVGEMRPEGDPAWFKSRLSGRQLSLLKVLGLLPRASNREYFRGHVAGKVGIRPAANVRLGVHRAFDPAGGRAPHFKDPRLQVLHYESPSAEDFVRKWASLMASGPAPRQKRTRTLIGKALVALWEQELPEAEVAAFLDLIYDRVGADDVETLRGLKLLQHVDPDTETQSPRALPTDVRDSVTRGLVEFRDQRKAPVIAEVVGFKQASQRGDTDDE